MAKPVVIVNCKTYPEATGGKAVRLAKLCEAMARAHNIDIRIAVQTTDIAAVAKAVKIPVYAQHVDAAEPGKTTGWTTAFALKKAGAAGTLLNHAEHRISTQTICETTPYLRKARLSIVVIAENLDRLFEFGSIDADYFCVEPPELIGGEVSVSVARPDVIENAVRAARKPLLMGAGIKDYNDFSIALRLGAKGVLLSSGIVLASDQRKALLRLLTVRGQ